ncbi:MAG: M56 family metallopeptidase, partial [Lachnospiraceae bacterium]|nr:M56 family metallopeptidase [Lachnospiraceae bacterium]
MAFSAIHFFICNIFISVIIGIILLARRIFLKNSPPRLKYSLWFVLPVLMAAPFLKLKMPGFLQLLEKFSNIKNALNTSENSGIQPDTGHYLSGSTTWINDFTISQTNSLLPVLDIILACIWISGILVMACFFIKGAIKLYHLKQSALPLQNQEVYKLYLSCLNETCIKRKIPVFSTAFLKSPVLSGFIRPQIYLPIHLISEYNAPDMRFMLLHELQHYKHKDLLFNAIMNIAGIVYWFNPFVWLAIKEIRTDREIACDTSVLQMLNKDDYLNYGNTLINLAEKISFAPFPFTTGISGNMAQIKKRIINIASYSPLSFSKKLQNIIIYIIIAAASLSSAPVLSIM